MTTQQTAVNPTVLILCDGSFGRMTAIARAAAEGARAAGAKPIIKRVGGIVDPSDEEGCDLGGQFAPSATINDLEEVDAVLVSAGTSYGRLTTHMAAFLDQVLDLSDRSMIVGKPGGAIVSAGKQPGGEEGTFISLVANLMQLGMVIVSAPSGPPDVPERDGMFPQHTKRVPDFEGEEPWAERQDQQLVQAYRLGSRIAMAAVKLAA